MKRNVAWALFFTLFCSAAFAKTICVNPSSIACYPTINTAAHFATPGDVIQVAAGTYKEYVMIDKPLSIIGSGAPSTVIDATGLAHGILVDGFHHPGLSDVTIAGFTIRNALFEGLLVVTAADVTIRNNSVVNNDKSQGLQFTGATTGCPGQPGDEVYENDETGDCGGAIHLIGATESILADNYISGNADGILISDETAESSGNLVIGNTVRDNPLECGIVMASHPPTGHVTAPFANHFGVDHNTVANNVSTGNGVQVGGSGVGLFSDGNGWGRVSGNVVVGNTLIGNGLGGVALHTHVGPAFGLPADDMSGNMIIGNYISGNAADFGDTATPGPVGININSGGGGSPVRGTVITQNVIVNEQVDVAVNTPAEVDVHLNNLWGGGVGVANICTFDKAKICGGSVDATENYWGCSAGPGNPVCSTASGVGFTPWLSQPIKGGDDPD